MTSGRNCRIRFKQSLIGLPRIQYKIGAEHVHYTAAVIGPRYKIGALNPDRSVDQLHVNLSGTRSWGLEARISLALVKPRYWLP
jgi:hypothetical protein